LKKINKQAIKRTEDSYTIAVTLKNFL